MNAHQSMVNRLLDLIESGMTASMAGELDRFRATPEEQARIDELADKNNSGVLSEDESIEYEEVVSFIDLTTLLRQRAVRVLKRDAARRMAEVHRAALKELAE
jgi:hypothetical protein